MTAPAKIQTLDVGAYRAIPLELPCEKQVLAPQIKVRSDCAAAARYGVPGCDPGERYVALADKFGSPVARRVEAPATAQQKAQLAALTPQQITATELAGERIENILSHAPGNGAPIGGIKVNATSGWFAARPSGTENIYKIYAESFTNAAHLKRIITQAQAIVDAAVSIGRK